MTIWREEDLLEPTASQSWHYSLLPKQRLGICQYTTNMFYTWLHGSPVSESHFKQHMSIFESKVLDTAKSRDDYIATFAICIAAVDKGAQQCQIHISKFIEEILSSDQMMSNRQKSEQGVVRAEILLDDNDTGKYRRSLHSVLSGELPLGQLEEVKGTGPTAETYLMAEIASSLPEVWFMSDEQQQQQLEQEQREHEQEQQKYQRKGQQQDKQQVKQKQQYHQNHHHQCESQRYQNNQHQNERHRQQQQQQYSKTQPQEQKERKHINKIEQATSEPACPCTQTQKATDTKMEVEEEDRTPTSTDANKTGFLSKPAITLDWGKEVSRDERIKVCQHIYSKTKPHYNHMTGEQLKNCICVYEAQTYEASKCRHAYLSTIADFLSHVDQKSKGKP